VAFFLSAARVTAAFSGELRRHVFRCSDRRRCRGEDDVDDAILAGLTTIAQEWQPLAVAWHAGAAGLIVMLWRGVDRRSIAALLALMAFSVATLAAWAGNPFNAAVFAATGTFMIVLAATRVSGPRGRVSNGHLVAGAIMCAFGWVYPHFLTGSPWQYAYAAPLGLIPCPTLAFIIGVSLLTNGFGSRAWGALFVGLGLLYGLIGVFALDVTIDWMLIIGAVLLAPALLSFQLPRTVAIETEKRHV
jgi:hypothetical protein